MHPRGKCVWLLILGYASAAIAGDQPPWTLTNRERADLRKTIERHEPVRAESTTEPARAAFVIDGREHPELFMPSELIASLLNTQDDDQQVTVRLRGAYIPWLSQFRWPAPAFWHDLDSAATRYWQLLNAANTPIRSPDTSRAICRERALVLSTMRRKYPRFDEFLYVAVAPPLTLASDSDRPTDWLLWIEDGCK